MRKSCCGVLKLFCARLEVLRGKFGHVRLDCFELVEGKKGDEVVAVLDADAVAAAVRDVCQGGAPVGEGDSCSQQIYSALACVCSVKPVSVEQIWNSTIQKQKKLIFAPFL